MTRIYANCKEAIGEIKRNLYEMGIRVWPNSYQNKIIGDNENFSTKELQSENFSIVDTYDKDDIVGTDLEWCKAEFKERVSREENNPGNAWKLRFGVWKPFLNTEGKMDYSYSDRMKSQLDRIIDELKNNPETRQAIIELHNNDKDLDSIGGKKRIPCFEANTRIISDKIKKIKDIKEGDFVLGSDGKYNKVLHTMKRFYEGNMNKIKCSKYSEEISVTPEHPILGLSVDKKIRNDLYKKTIEQLDKKEIKPDFISAEDIKKGDFLCFAFPNDTNKNKNLDIDKYIDLEKGNQNSVKIKSKIKLTKELGMIFGYYLSEGDIMFDKRNGRKDPSTVRFSFNITEDDLVNEVIGLFDKVFGLKDYKITKFKQYNSQRISFSNRNVAELLVNLFGHGAKDKKIDREIYNMDKEFQKGIIIGFMKGDGSKEKRNGLYHLNCGVVSIDLINGIRMLLLRQGIIPSFTITDREIDSKIKSIGRREYTVYRLDFVSDDLLFECFGLKNGPKSKENSLGFIHNGIAYYPCKSNKSEVYKDWVYNLSVAGTQTYNIVPFTTHNCSMFYQFMIRKDSEGTPRLSIIYVMRSSDFYTHFKNDIWLAVELRDYIAKELNIKTGLFTMFVSSLHMFKKDMEEGVY
jgi:thymidylate synthase